MSRDELEENDYYGAREEFFEQRDERRRWEDEINERSKPL